MNTQRGNALWFILIGVALLGALTMILSRGGSGVDQSGDFEQRQVKVSQMLRYAKSLEAGIQQMRLRGVSENDVSFWHDSDGNGTEDASDDYFNANCTTPDCHIFDVGGAGLTYTPPASGLSDATDCVFSSSNIVDDIGTTAPDLIMMLPQVKTSVCAHINRILGSSYSGTESGVDFTEFTGSYTTAQTINFADGQEAGCVDYDPGGGVEPLFYYVLIKR